MRPHWYNADGEPVCELHASDEEGDLNEDERDTPANCAVCGKPCNYSLTEAGIRYVIDAIMEKLDEGPAAWNELHPPCDCYYGGSRLVEVVRDWAKDLQSYGLSKADTWLVDYFLTTTS